MDKYRTPKLVAALALTVVVVWLSSAPAETENTKQEEQEVGTNAVNNLNVQAAINEIKAEKVVVDMTYDPSAAIQWHIGVYDNKTPRHGYASYICGVLSSHNIVDDRTFVRIVDIQRVRQGKNFRDASLGRVNCSTYQNYSP